jgi:hypothetical protein
MKELEKASSGDERLLWHPGLFVRITVSGVDGEVDRAGRGAGTAARSRDRHGTTAA